MDATWEGTQLSDEADVWELYHENSKVTRYLNFPSEPVILSKMASMYESLPYEGYATFPLPEHHGAIDQGVDALMTMRKSARSLARTLMRLDQVAAILRLGYGITRINDSSAYPRSFRTVPSGGALYPLELYLYAGDVEDLSGLYHFNAKNNTLSLLRPGDQTAALRQCFVQSDLPDRASVLVFITAIFERTVFKYGARGYRFAMIEAGHVAQNINLCSVSMGLGCLNIGGFYDHDIDNYLGLDGIGHSTIYAVAIGKDRDGADSSRSDTNEHDRQ
ncbi:SagB/ThcOx family dehydrogenase [Azospirillum sp. TSO35-2]|uniref:SagB/ThcOx family dehydrogenase n=1 Tax=Azospirillum sp. TSO35-2 TaxID=716796 RepID=UPI000D647F3A|nr:SagB/ThcOx family dehydrogenase [Azospirillum sp. TSO35-2]